MSRKIRRQNRKDSKQYVVRSKQKKNKLSTAYFLLILTAYCLLPAAYCFGWSEPVAIDAGPFNAYRTDIAFDMNGNAISVFEQKNGDVYRVFASRYANGKGWESAVPIDSGIGNGYRGQVAFDRKGNAIAVFKQEIGNGRYRIFANYYKNPYTDTDTHTATNIGWQGAIPIDNGTGNADGQDIVFDSEGNAAAVFEAKDGEEMGIYVNLYNKGWSGAFRIDSGIGNAYFPNPLFDDKGNLYVTYYKEESGGLEVYVSSINRGLVAAGFSLRNDATIKVAATRLTDGNTPVKKEKWAEKKSEITRGIKGVYNPNFLGEVTKRIYSGNYSYSRWETPSKLDARFRDAYRPTLLANGKGEVTALFVKWDGQYLSGYASNYRNGEWGKPEEIDSGKGDVEHIRGAMNLSGEMAVVWTQWVDTKVISHQSPVTSLRIHARIYKPSSGWSNAEIIDAGNKDAYNPSIIFTNSGEIIAVWCQWEKANVKSYTNIYRKGIGWGNAERLESKEGETCGVRIASGHDGKVIAIFEQEGDYSEDRKQKTEDREARRINRIFAVSFNANIHTDTDTYTIKKLTDGDREDYYAEFSPDGKMIVFVSIPLSSPLTKGGNKKGGSNLYIMDADGKNMRQLTSGDVIDTAPVFTSDGGRIIFASNRTDERWDIWSINTDGSGLIRLTNDKTNELAPRTTSDGNNIVFVSTAGGDHAIWSMDINGENKKRLTSGGTGDWFPAMNPDGKEVVFVSTRLGNGDVWTIDSVEKKYHRLTYTDLPEFSPAWSPDGSKIAYVTNKGGEFDIWIMDKDGKNKRRLTKGISDRNWGSRFSSRKILETAGYYHLSWHPDGTKILFTEWRDEDRRQKTEDRGQKTEDRGQKTEDRGQKTYISVIEFDKNVIERLEVDSSPIHDYTLIGEKELTKGEWEDFAPSFSPDGTSLTFSSNRGGNWDIWSMEFNGEDLKQLTKGTDDELAPVYSPDGKEIAYLKISNFKSQISNYDLWVMNSDGSGARQVTKNIPIISYPAWHPGSNEIAFVARGEDGTEIWTYNLKSEIQISKLKIQNSQNGPRIYPFKEFLYRIGYNPGGDKITFESNVSGNVEIWTMRSDGTNLARLTNGDSPHWNPVWSPDGKMIAYTTDKLGDEAGLHNWRNYNIWIANPETQKEMLITGEEQIDWNPVWSPDGKKIVYVTNRSNDFKHFSLWVLYLK